MSKISLEPNASGAGTFTLAAPNSNTNRTLTLPDEAGTILSDASTIDSNNLQSDVYKQSNIIGTVSESGGVPTGAIIESGSNANGEFVKYADGTLICTTTKAIITDDDPDRGFPLNGATRAQSVSYPASFVGNNPSGFVTLRQGASPSNRSWFFTSVLQTNGTRWFLRGSTNSGDTSPEDFHFGAIGRWF